MANLKNPFEEISRANDEVESVISLAASKKEYIGKQIINTILLFIILLVFGCLDFARLTFHFEYLGQVSYWGTTISKTIAGVCAFNIGINLMWETELRKNLVLAAAIKFYKQLIEYKRDDFEYYVVKVFNPTEKKKAYISQINKQIYRLNRFSRARDRLLYSSDLPERQVEKEKNHYCIRRKELEDLKNPEFIEKNLDALKVKYYYVDPTVFELEIDGSVVVRGVKTKGNIAVGKAKASTNVVVGMIGISMFLSAIGLELNQEEFANQMVRFWHYLLKCATDTGIILWQTYRGMLNVRKIISNEYTQPFVGRNTVLTSYYKWQLEEGKITQEFYKRITTKPKVEVVGEVEMTESEYKEMAAKKKAEETPTESQEE